MSTLDISKKAIFLLFIISSREVFCSEVPDFDSQGEDSYLKAYKKSHSESVKVLDSSVKRSDREFQVNPNDGYPYPTPQPQYGSPVNYGPSGSQYDVHNPYPPLPAYGPPAPPPAYGPPAPPVYGPPAPPPVYGPPAPPPAYGPPVYGPPSSVQVFYGVPHALGSIWDKLKFKLSLFTLGKILLKLIIFKKIVSWIAVLCLLLFIPSLKQKVESSDGSLNEGSRAFGKFSDETVSNMTDFILRALDSKSFEEKYNQTIINNEFHQNKTKTA
nr:basic proline-rich protein-like [Leptinotarsa decemlineata]